MSAADIRISVVVPAFKAAGTLERLLRSLDAQTMPQEEFEVVVVDDGSPDDTLETLHRLQRDRPNLVAHRIDPSGWASRPRNVGTALARGEYVLYMDSDDTLFPDALRRSYDFAAEHDADVLSPKESQTKQPWWGMASFRENIANLKGGDGIEGLLPMTPHKLFRRAFLEEHDLTFQESEDGRRILWEDVRLVMAAYRHARVVSVLADTPVYHWHSNAGSISKSYGARTEEFWDQVEGLLQYIQHLFPGAAFAAEREAMLLQQYKVRLLGRFTTLAATAPDEEVRMPFARLRDLQARYMPVELDARLGVLDRSRAELVRAGRLDLLVQLVAADKAISNASTVTGAEWREGMLHVSTRTTWSRPGGSPFAADGDRIVRDLPEAVAAALPRELVDVTDALASVTASVWIRDPKRIITWALPTTWTARLVRTKTGGRTVEIATETVLDPERALFGRPLDPAQWEFWIETAWIGALRRSRMRYKEAPRALLRDGTVAELRRNDESKLVLDTSVGPERALRLGRPPVNVSLGTVSAFRMPLPALEAVGTVELPAELPLVPADGHGTAAVIRGRLVTDGTGVRFEGSGPVAAGDYRIAEPDGAVLTGGPTIRVGRGGRARILRAVQPWTRDRVVAAVRRRLAAYRA
ncbi:MAG: glycosyltransferase family 2 protein [Amnibacterium sp.]